MDLVPVKNYAQPKYPVKDMVLNYPGLLKTVPERWKNNVYIGTALSTILVLTLSSCTIKRAGGNNPKVAPIFEHGSGKGSYGCVSVAPPAFLSEEEAFQTINEEAGKYGISFDKEGLKLKDVRVPKTKYYEGTINSSVKGNLTLDGFDKEKDIGFEFISSEDYNDWHVKESMGSSVQRYDFLSAAEVLQKGLSDKEGSTAIGVFYNPLVEYNDELFQKLKNMDNWKEKQDYVTGLAEEQLRKQIVDFLEWLNSEGII